MSNFAIEGLISGFDTTELINAILDAQVRGPVTQIQSRVEQETTKLTALQSVNANLLGLTISAQSLTSTSLFQGKQISSSNTSVVTATASNGAPTGGFNIRVDNLAQADQISSDIFTSGQDALELEGAFILNGRVVSVSPNDSLANLASRINSAGAGVRASVVQIAPNQNKLVLSSQAAGVGGIELREVGAADILSSLGLITAGAGDVRYDYTVNANTEGAVSEKFASDFVQTYTGQTFTVQDAGGQHTLTVTLNGVDLTLEDIAGAINTQAGAQGANISASVIADGEEERLLITSTTGIPSRFEDPDNVLFGLGVVGGLQSASFTASDEPIGTLLNLGSTTASTLVLSDGDGSHPFANPVTIDLGEDSLEDIVQKINNEALASGSDITARVIAADGQSRLEISSATGRPVITSDTGQVLQTLGVVDRQFKHYDQQGENSQFAFNGVTVNRTNNLVTDLVEGVSIALVQESGQTATLSVTEDYANVSSVIEDFVDAYNNLISYLGEQTYFDPEGENNGVLFGNSVVRDLKNSLAAAVSRSIPNLPGVKLSDLNDGKGVSLGSIKITDRSGHSAVIDLREAGTVQDVLDAIRLETGIQVSAEASTGGTSINLIDRTGKSGLFQVEEVDGGTTAQDLGLDKQIYSNEIAGSSIYGGGATSLATIGISLTTAGSLTFDSTALQAALDEDPEQVKNLIQAATVGFADYFQTEIRRFTAYETGLMDSTTKAVQEKIDLYNQQIQRYQDRAETLESTLRKKFTALEVTLSQSQQMSQYLTQKLGIQSSE
ncbi:MAG: flagellar filament capping protein FliD [bacterium]